MKKLKLFCLKFVKGPESVDWRLKGLDGPVRDQGGCASCWAFSAAYIAEGVLRKQNKTFETSKQQLVDCVTVGANGCNTGWPEWALRYVQRNGIAETIDYRPYNATRRNCTYVPTKAYGTVKQVFNVSFVILLVSRMNRGLLNLIIDQYSRQ